MPSSRLMLLNGPRLTHRVPFLWRFHVVHHIRAAQVVTIGVSPLALSIWQTGLLVSILFHHSNVHLPVVLECRLALVVVTSRLRGIHHSIVRTETDSNWSSGLTLWDRLHGTLRLDVLQDAITIGVPAYREPREVTLPPILAMPFARARPSWQLPEGGKPLRTPEPLC